MRKNNFINLVYGLFIRNVFFFLFVVFSSCKKEKITTTSCSCPAAEETLNSIYNLRGNSFFVFKQYYAINNHTLQLDSCYTHATKSAGPENYPGGYYQFFYGDSAKVNGVKFTRFTQTIGFVAPYNNTCFSSPRLCEYYGDSTYFFWNTIHLDQTPLPQYNDYNLLPDSININQDSVINIGSRYNLLNTEVALKGYLQQYPWEYFHTELLNSQKSFTVPKLNLQTLGVGYAYIVINIRNWSNIIEKKKSTYFVSDHCYIKKIKLYS